MESSAASYRIEDVPSSGAEPLARLARQTKLENFDDPFELAPFREYVERTHAMSVVARELADPEQEV